MKLSEALHKYEIDVSHTLWEGDGGFLGFASNKYSKKYVMKEQVMIDACISTKENKTK